MMGWESVCGFFGQFSLLYFMGLYPMKICRSLTLPCFDRFSSNFAWLLEWWSEGLYVCWQFSLLSLWNFNNSLLNMSLANSSLLWLIFLKLYKTIRNCVLGFCILFDNVYLCCFRDLSQNFSIPWKMVCCIATSTLPWSIFIELYKIIRNGFLRVYIKL